MVRLIPVQVKASRMMKRARRLHNQGNHSEAYQSALNAFDLINEHARADDPYSCVFIVTYNRFLDSLAVNAGHAGATVTQITTAMRMCESMCGDMAKHTPKYSPKAQELLEWYRKRTAS